MTLKIEPFIGFGNIRLGQFESEVIELLGEPDSRDEEEFTDNTTNRNLEYNALGIELSFSSEDDYKLSTITFNTTEAELKGTKLLGLSEEDFLERMAELEIDDLNLDSDFKDLNSKDYLTDSLGLSFWIQDGFVDSITLYPEYEDDDETIIWPTIKEA